MFKQFEAPRLIMCAGVAAAWNRLIEIQKDYQAERIIQNLQLLGVSGLGKSTLARCFVAENPPHWEGEVRVTPAVYFKVPPSPSAGAVFAGICAAFGGPTVGKPDDLRDRAVTYARRCRSELLFVDEAHHFLDRGQQKTHALSGDFWKVFQDEFPGNIVFIGAPRVRTLLSINTQWRNRAGEDIFLRPFPYDAYENDLGGFVRSSCAGTCLECVENFLYQADIFPRIQYATDGVPAHVVALMSKVERKVRAGHVLDLQLLDSLWQQFPGTKHLTPQRRPFCPEFNFARLDKPGEPYQPGALDGDNHAYW